jgi:hypothetical protein
MAIGRTEIYRTKSFFLLLFVCLFAPIFGSFKRVSAETNEPVSLLFLAPLLLLVTLPYASTFVGVPIVASIPALAGFPFFFFATVMFLMSLLLSTLLLQIFLLWIPASATVPDVAGIPAAYVSDF